MGCWRLKEVRDSFDVPTTLALNGSGCAEYPRIAEEALKADWEFMGHGFSQLSMQKVEDEREDIQKTRDIIKNFTGTQPRGWLGPHSWRPTKPWTCSKRKASSTCPTGYWTINP